MYRLKINVSSSSTLYYMVLYEVRWCCLSLYKPTTACRSLSAAYLYHAGDHHRAAHVVEPGQQPRQADERRYGDDDDDDVVPDSGTEHPQLFDGRRLL